jgi:type II secretory pathway pseudopilin PulG
MIKMKKAFSMITAIFVIIIMATVAVLVFNLSEKTIKGTSIQFRTEQAAILARSYTELAVLAVMNYNRQTATPPDCVETIDGVVNSIIPGAAPAATTSSTNGGGYDIQTHIYYLGDNLPCTTSRILDSNPIDTPYGPTGSPDELAAIIVDVYVRYKDPGSDDPSTAPWITYHRRTLQKI